MISSTKEIINAKKKNLRQWKSASKSHNELQKVCGQLQLAPEARRLSGVVLIKLVYFCGSLLRCAGSGGILIT
eukprot:scaffold2045_cov203-Alexandrium_tamarense.AAC.20